MRVFAIQTATSVSTSKIANGRTVGKGLAHHMEQFSPGDGRWRNSEALLSNRMQYSLPGEPSANQKLTCGWPVIPQMGAADSRESPNHVTQTIQGYRSLAGHSGFTLSGPQQGVAAFFGGLVDRVRNRPISTNRIVD